ncbi:MAG: glycosyltransferase family 39 protein [Solirubrobacteraceae bacterium]|jgi:4-amino-4-deoxy-L-arabinose transferase-like glycosyltransferase
MSSIGIAGGVATTASNERQAAIDGRWARGALIALLLATAAAYTWNLSASGHANSFYAAAVQAGTENWKAFFFGSLDSSNFITVDKPPASLWVMALSGRMFGFGSWSMLAPQALEGVGAVALLYGAVKRWFGAAAGLGAGAMLALTPVAALMFRFNNPDALLVALLVAAAYCLTRAIERASTRWILATGALVGFAFLAKMGQALLVVPAFGLAYLIAAPTTLRRRTLQLLGGLGALIAAAGWWVAIVALTPVSSRPFIDGSPDNNIFNLIFGYNGLSRIFGGGGPGGAGGAAGGGGGGQSFSGPTGVLRLFNDLMGGQASWLLPAALVALIVGLWLRRAAPRTDRGRAALLLWGGWLLVTAAIFSFSQGVIHTYYAVALAPAIGALVAIGATLLWERRTELWARACAAVTVAGTAAWSYALLDRTPSWQPWLRTVLLLAALVATVGLLAAPLVGRHARRAGRLALASAVVACLAGPVAYTAQTVTTTHSGPIPSAGPTVASTGRPGGGGPGGFPGGFPGGTSAAGRGASAGAGPIGPAGLPAPGSAPTTTQSSLFGLASAPPGGARAGSVAPSGISVTRELASALKANAGRYRWVAATMGATSAASLELATGGDPVMAIGGFNNNGGELSLTQFRRYVTDRDIHYYVASMSGGIGGAPGQTQAASTGEISSWVASHFKAETLDGSTVYDLSS